MANGSIVPLILHGFFAGGNGLNPIGEFDYFIHLGALDFPIFRFLLLPGKHRLESTHFDGLSVHTTSFHLPMDCIHSST